MPTVVDGSVVFAAGLTVSLQRTLRLPTSGGPWPLPPGFGPLPIHVAGPTVHDRPASSNQAAAMELLVPLRQGEATWIHFAGRHWRPVAVQVGLGEINALSAGSWATGLEAGPQNYVVCPDQPWLDGINIGDGIVRQFVAAPLGSGRTVEGRLTTTESRGGLRLRVFPSVPGRFPDVPPAPPPGAGRRETPMPDMAPSGGEMGLSAGGRMRQRIYPDRHGITSWDEGHREEITIRLLNSKEYRVATGEEPPPSPISAEAYARLDLPWFDLYDEHLDTLDAPEALCEVRPFDEP